MKALTLTEPWASLVAIGAKRIETRSWPAYYRGRIAIHAGKKFTGDDLECAQDEDYEDALLTAGVSVFPQGGMCGPVKDAFPDTRGCVIATATLSHCGMFDEQNVEVIRQTYGERELRFGDFTPGRFGFVLTDVIRLPEPIPAMGSLGLWEWEPPLMEDAA